ncbi:hypothetical protein MPSEU_000614100 [Mayamaea pseudoterrestris]|nr:hypothetical protein MPSEU_000614100 [Mayamaea pseudoterrestris]
MDEYLSKFEAKRSISKLSKALKTIGLVDDSSQGDQDDDNRFSLIGADEFSDESIKSFRRPYGTGIPLTKQQAELGRKERMEKDIALKKTRAVSAQLYKKKMEEDYAREGYIRERKYQLDQLAAKSATEAKWNKQTPHQRILDMVDDSDEHPEKTSMRNIYKVKAAIEAGQKVDATEVQSDASE